MSLWEDVVTAEDRLRMRWAPEIKRYEQASKWELFKLKLFGDHDWIKDGDYWLHIATLGGKTYVVKLYSGANPK